MLKIALIDDHVMFGESLQNLFQNYKDYKKVKYYVSGDDFFNDYEKFSPNVVITDLNMPNLSGAEFVEKCKIKLNNKVKIIILSMISDNQTIKKMIRMGVKGYVSKTSDISELMLAIDSTQINKCYISNDLKEMMKNNLFTQEQVTFQLSPRENEVLHKVCNGQSIKEIAFDLNLSPSTIQYYHKCIMQKFKLKRTRTSDLIVFAIKHGLFIPNFDNN